MGHSSLDPAFQELRPWNEGRVIGAKRALKPQQVWAIRFWLDQHRRLRDAWFHRADARILPEAGPFADARRVHAGGGAFGN